MTTAPLPPLFNNHPYDARHFQNKKPAMPQIDFLNI